MTSCMHFPRYHAVQEFNRGVFNYLIATDESGLEGIEKDSDDEASDNEEPACKSIGGAFVAQVGIG